MVTILTGVLVLRPHATQAIGQDAATLLVGLSLPFVGLLLARKSSLLGELLPAGGLGYILYTYTS